MANTLDVLVACNINQLPAECGILKFPNPLLLESYSHIINQKSTPTHHEYECYINLGLLIRNLICSF